jgi:hypothetical protein
VFVFGLGELFALLLVLFLTELLLVGLKPALLLVGLKVEEPLVPIALSLLPPTTFELFLMPYPDLELLYLFAV